VSDLTLHALENLKTLTGEPVASLESAIMASGETPLFIEGKGSNWARPLAAIIKKHNNNARCTVISFNHRELYIFSKNSRNVPCFALERHNPFDAINAARMYGFEGIDLNYWILNPLAYWLARRHKFDIAVYTVNKTWIASFLRIFYPNIALTTNFPHHMQFIRPKHLRVKQKKRRNK
jgi:glycerophosphoryl diester phosphodiesterase